MTIASAPRLVASLTILNCSDILTGFLRTIGVSLPSSYIIIAAVPVVFAITLRPDSLRPAAISLVVVDFPRVPFT